MSTTPTTKPLGSANTMLSRFHAQVDKGTKLGGLYDIVTRADRTQVCTQEKILEGLAYVTLAATEAAIAYGPKVPDTALDAYRTFVTALFGPPSEAAQQSMEAFACYYLVPDGLTPSLYAEALKRLEDATMQSRAAVPVGSPFHTVHWMTLWVLLDHSRRLLSVLLFQSPSNVAAGRELYLFAAATVPLLVHRLEDAGMLLSSLSP